MDSLALLKSVLVSGSTVSEIMDAIDPCLKSACEGAVELNEIHSLDESPAYFMFLMALAAFCMERGLSAPVNELKNQVQTNQAIVESLFEIVSVEPELPRWNHHRWHSIRNRKRVRHILENHGLTAEAIQRESRSLATFLELLMNGGDKECALDMFESLKSKHLSQEEIQAFSPLAFALFLHTDATRSDLPGLKFQLEFVQRVAEETSLGLCSQLPLLISRLKALLEMNALEEDLQDAGLYDTDEDRFTVRLDTRGGFFAKTWNGIKYGFERCFHSSARMKRLHSMQQFYTYMRGLGMRGSKLEQREKSLKTALGARGRVVGALIFIGEMVLLVSAAYFLISLVIVAGILLLIIWAIANSGERRTEGTPSGPRPRADMDRGPSGEKRGPKRYPARPFHKEHVKIDGEDFDIEGEQHKPTGDLFGTRKTELLVSRDTGSLFHIRERKAVDEEGEVRDLE